MDWRIRSTPQIMYLVTHHQYGLSALIPKTSFPGETVCWHHKTCWLFSQPLHYVIQSSNTMLNDTICVMCSCHNTELLFQLAWCNHTSQNVPQNLKNNFVGYASCHNLQSFVSHHTRGGCCIGDCPTGACPIGDGWPMTDCPCIGDGCCCAGYGMCDKPCCWGGGL